jgi:DNA-binding NtrC family response regulator
MLAELRGLAMDQVVPREREGQYRTKIILAEDEVLVRMVLADALRREGFQVIEAVHAEDAIKALSLNPDVALVVCDMRMRSAEDGMVLARYVRAHHAGVTLVLAAAQSPLLNDDLFDVSFPKPYEPDRIANWIKRHIKSRRVTP